MIEYIEGGIFESPAQVISIVANTVGGKGKGLAHTFRTRDPELYERYRAVCEQGLLNNGSLMLFYEDDYWVLLFPAKENWRRPSKLEYIEAGLKKFVQTYAEKGITSIAFPRLGCGNGELEWSDVKQLMEKYLKNLPIPIYIYLGKHPDQKPEHRDQRKTSEWLKSHAKDMSFIGVRDDLRDVSSMFPYGFQWGNKSVSMRYADGAFHFTGVDPSASIVLSEDELYRVWDHLRTSSVVSLESLTEQESLLCALLRSAGYLSEIKVYDPGIQQMRDGYQLNAGVGRMSVYGNK